MATETTPQITLAKLDDLIPYANNAREHTDEQVAQVAASIQEFGWTNPIITHGQTVVAGHARLAAARKLNLKEVPVIDRSDMSEAQWKAYVLADNQLAQNATWNEGLLTLELDALAELDFNLDLLGFGDLDALMDTGEPEKLKDSYNKSIETPIYEITGEKPSVSDLYSSEKTERLLKEIKESDLPDDIAEFLIHAAQRHTVFDFRNIAEFYAHSDAVTQNLFERSALIIIDFESAIENGYVESSKYFAEFADEDEEASNNA